MTQSEHFNVYFIYPDGTNTRERENLTAEAAVKFSLEATRRPAAAIGILAEIMITDSGDYCAWHWKADKGLIFPFEREIK